MIIILVFLSKQFVCGFKETRGIFLMKLDKTVCLIANV